MSELRSETLEKIKEAIGEDNVKENEVMAQHLSMRAGGPARYFFTPGNVHQLTVLIEELTLDQVPFYIMGNGTNIIVRDEGYDGAIIQLLERFNGIKAEERTIKAQAGVRLKALADAALNNDLTGLEFASGIPGTLGGAVTMNAGAYGGEMKDVLKSITVLNNELKVETIKAEDAELSYRHSLFSDGGYVILEAEMELMTGEKDRIKAMMDDFNGRRKEKQPLEFPSCGSTFKRPEGYFAGKLIQDSGLSGARVGGACVSPKHCGFIVNDQHGTATDVLELIELVKRTVKEKQGVDLECEVRIL